MNQLGSDDSSITQPQVCSKYFSGEPVMDESLCDFQEKKVVTKQGPKSTVPKKDTKKRVKRIRGQKDIRTALNPKKNELIAYANDFDKICKQSGIDVDSEQLQLAIALSKSLQQTEGLVESSNPSKLLSTQERTGKIRTTLQEYGFKVPETKIIKSKSRKLKRYNKYKLLTTSESEKQQIIADKFSQVLLQNIECKRQADCTDLIVPFCYRIASEVPYEQIKDDDIYYIEGFVEKSVHTVGSLLRDWSEIPGRPVTPKIERSEVIFKEIDCNQEELDRVLSGPLDLTQELVSHKYKSVIGQKVNYIEHNPVHSSKVNTVNMDIDVIAIDDDKTHISHKDSAGLKDKDTLSRSNVRSCSPDIFDEEVSAILEDCTTNTAQVNNEEATKVTTEYIDLTEHATIQTNQRVDRSVIEKSSFQQSQENKTKRKSNDFMELTSCVAGSSQPLLNVIEEKIDLTQNSDHDLEQDQDPTIQIPTAGAQALLNYEKIDQDINDESRPNIAKDTSIEKLDLTQSSDSSDLPFVHISGTQKLDDSIIPNEDEYRDIEKEPNMVANRDTEIKNQGTESIFKENTEGCQVYLTKGFRKKYSGNDTNYSKQNDVSTVNENDDITSANVHYRQSQVKAADEYDQSKSQSFFEEFSHPHSDEPSKETVDLCLDSPEMDLNNRSPEIDLTNGSPETDTINRSAEIDLTNKSGDENDEISFAVATDKGFNKTPISFDNTSLGKKDNVSIDYDELFDDLVGNSTNSTKRNITETYTRVSNELSSSQASDVFEISDQELDYSVHKSRLESDNIGNFDFGGISVVDNIPDLPSLRQSTNYENYNNSVQNESKANRIQSLEAGDTNLKERVCETPCNVKEFLMKTPGNNEYIIKTDMVTPMQDYEGMTTPERNKELDKYGLKPFKRKRAIQLLTHLYNQTHPIIEACEDFSAFKKTKRDHYTEPSSSQNIQKSPIKSPRRVKSPRRLKSPKKVKSPRKVTSPAKVKSFSKANSPSKAKSPRKVEGNVNNDNDLYEITNSPELRDVPCSEEDWVFQKKEKAKLPSCRVPLHIAFHNLVTSRRSLQNAILRYEPVDIAQLHRGLSDAGHRFDAKDLLKFLDKKCITVKTADSAKGPRKHF